MRWHSSLYKKVTKQSNGLFYPARIGPFFPTREGPFLPDPNIELFIIEYIVTDVLNIVKDTDADVLSEDA